MHDLGKQDFFLSVEIADLKKDLFFLVVNINRISFSNYENPVNISIFIANLHNLLTSSDFFVDDLTLENIENKLIQKNKLESLEYFELEANIDDFENSALRNHDHIFFFYKVPSHLLITQNNLSKDIKRGNYEIKKNTACLTLTQYSDLLFVCRPYGQKFG